MVGFFSTSWQEGSIFFLNILARRLTNLHMNKLLVIRDYYCSKTYASSDEVNKSLWCKHVLELREFMDLHREIGSLLGQFCDYGVRYVNYFPYKGSSEQSIIDWSVKLRVLALSLVSCEAEDDNQEYPDSCEGDLKFICRHASSLEERFFAAYLLQKVFKNHVLVDPKLLQDSTYIPWHYLKSPHVPSWIEKRKDEKKTSMNEFRVFLMFNALEKMGNNPLPKDLQKLIALYL